MAWLYPVALGLLFGAPFYFLGRWRRPAQPKLIALGAALLVGGVMFVIGLGGVLCGYYCNPV